MKDPDVHIKEAFSYSYETCCHARPFGGAPGYSGAAIRCATVHFIYYIRSIAMTRGFAKAS